MADSSARRRQTWYVPDYFLSRVHLGAIERAESACSLDVLEKIAGALGSDAPTLLTPGRR